MSSPPDLEFRPPWKQRCVVAFLSCPQFIKTVNSVYPNFIVIHSFALIYICRQIEITGLTATRTVMYSGLNSSSGGELKLYLNCAGSMSPSRDSREHVVNMSKTTMHSSRMPTAHCSSCLFCHACSLSDHAYPLSSTPPTTHTPCHTCAPPPCMPLCHACPLATHAPQSHRPPTPM